MTTTPAPPAVAAPAVAAPGVAAPGVAAPGVAAPAVAAPEPSLPAAQARLQDRLGVWVFSIVFIVMFPLFPIFVEMVKTGEVKPESYLLTTAVLAVGYGFTSQRQAFWAFYGLLFLCSLTHTFNPSAVLPSP